MFEDVATLEDVATVKLRHCHSFGTVLAALKLEDAEHRVAAISMQLVAVVAGKKV